MNSKMLVLLIALLILVSGCTTNANNSVFSSCPDLSGTSNNFAVGIGIIPIASDKTINEITLFSSSFNGWDLSFKKTLSYNTEWAGIRPSEVVRGERFDQMFSDACRKGSKEGENVNYTYCDSTNAALQASKIEVNSSGVVILNQKFSFTTLIFNESGFLIDGVCR